MLSHQPYEDKINCCCLLPRRYYLVISNDKIIKKTSMINHHTAQSHNTRSQKNTIYRMPVISGVVSQIFLGANFAEKREPPRITHGSSQLSSCGCPLHRTTLFSVAIFWGVGVLSRSSTPANYLYSFSRLLLMFPAVSPQSARNHSPANE